jgi:hypothetical protein
VPCHLTFSNCQSEIVRLPFISGFFCPIITVGGPLSDNTCRSKLCVLPRPVQRRRIE